MRIAMTPERHAAIFGPTLEEPGTGRIRKCKSCGDWHRLDRPWPHNCRKEGPRRNVNLAAPQLAPTFDAFMTGQTDDAVYIGDRGAKRDYMERNGLVEYDEGVTNEPNWVEQKRELDEVAQDLKRFSETDEDYWSPDHYAVDPTKDDLNTEGQDVDMTQVEIAK